MYINTQTNQYPVSERDIKTAFPNTSFPSPFNPPAEYQWVFPAPQPTHTPIIEMVREIAPVLINGHYEQRFEVVDVFTDYRDVNDVLHTKEEQETAALAAVEKAKVPTSVSMRQACIQLEMDGLLDDVEAMVATLPRIYQIEWQRASVVTRDNPLVEIVRQQKGMTEGQIDSLFINAFGR